MTMTRKHFQMVAYAINEHVKVLQSAKAQGNTDANMCIAAIRVVSDNLCAKFRAENPAFDKARFLKACGLEQ